MGGNRRRPRQLRTDPTRVLIFVDPGWFLNDPGMIERIWNTIDPDPGVEKQEPRYGKTRTRVRF